MPTLITKPRERRQAKKPTTKSARLAYDRLMKNLRALDDESNLDYAIRENIPQAWATLEDDLDVEEPKVKITLLLDKSVAAFYRGLGRGYQARMNRVLGTFAQTKIARVETFWDEMYEKDPWLLDDHDRDRRLMTQEEQEARVDALGEALSGAVGRAAEEIAKGGEDAGE